MLDWRQFESSRCVLSFHGKEYDRDDAAYSQLLP